MLFTDIVNSTQQASQVGDRRWRELLDVHDELARRLVEEAGGQVVKTTGDGVLATFDGPGEVLSSRTVRDLVVGSDVALESRGSRSLKGVEGKWQLFAVAER